MPRARAREASVKQNDENVLVIADDTRVADLYFVEFWRVFTHFRYRDAAVRTARDRGGAADASPHDAERPLGGPIRRPPGRSPKGKAWDSVSGAWVPDGLAAESDIAPATTSSRDEERPPGGPIRRPRGRAPKGKAWDSVSGAWVPDKLAAESDIAPPTPPRESSPVPNARQTAAEIKSAASLEKPASPPAPPRPEPPLLSLDPVDGDLWVAEYYEPGSLKCEEREMLMRLHLSSKPATSVRRTREEAATGAQRDASERVVDRLAALALSERTPTQASTGRPRRG